MDFSNIFVIILICGTLFNFILDFALERADFSFRKKHGREIPEEVKDFVDADTLDKTCRYEDAKYSLWLPHSLIDIFLMFYLLFMGFFPAVYEHAYSWTNGNGFLTILLFSIITGIPSMVLTIPFALYKEFGVEKHFGFSKMTAGMWISDQLKNIVLNLIVSAPLLAVAVFLFKKLPDWWWLLLGIVYVGFSLIVSIIYPLFIAPLFNKFTPLEDGELKTRLEELLKKCGFKASGLYVMDASKRSGHSNAYFTGFGKSKRVVLYDTLIQQLSADEIEAVLGHELGHYRHHHIVKRLVVMIPVIFAALFAVSLFIKMPYLYEGFGFTVGEYVPYQIMTVGLFMLSLVFEGLSPIMELVSNYSSRRNEFQADAFSAKVCGTGEPLVSALIKLNKENLSEIQVPKIYSAFNYSHPPLLERIRAVRAAYVQPSQQV